MSVTPNTGAAENTEITGPLSTDDAAEALLRQFLPPEEGSDAKKKPSEKKDKAASSGGDEDNTEQGTSETDDADKDSAEKPEDKSGAEETESDEETDGDEVLVKIKVGDDEHEVPVSKLTRLYGQEAALTKKSMEVAEQRKTYEGKLTEQAATTNALLERAKTRYEPYSKIDFHLLATQVTPEEYTALRQAAQAAYEDVQFLEKHTADFMQRIGSQRTEQAKTQAQEAIKVLSGPVDKGGLEGWSQKLYDDIRAFAVSQGAPAEVINSVTDPWAIKMIHAAMLFTRGKAKDQGKSDVKITKVNKTPKKIVKTTNSPAAARGDGKTGDAKKAFDKFQSSGSTDDAAEVMLARWKAAGDD